MPRIMLLGDSTCAAKRPDARPETGWGEMLPRFVREGWTVDNRAINGLATKDMIARGIFQEALDCLSSGDIVLLQFGHNDSKAEDPSRYSAPWTEYIVNLVYITSRIKAKGALPVIITSIARRRFSEGLIIDTHGDYPAAAKAAAHQSGCPCIDMTVPTMVALQAMGEEGSKECFMRCSPMCSSLLPRKRISPEYLPVCTAEVRRIGVSDQLGYLVELQIRGLHQLLSLLHPGLLQVIPE